jgi:hypothetical protein
MADRSIPAPIPDPTTRPFWDAAREGRFLIGRCRDTGRHFFPPRGVSPFTLSTEVELVPSSGRGTIYSFSVMRVAQPYAPAMVELEEGPRVFTNIVGADFAALRIGMAVRLVWTPTEGGGPPLPTFTPA